MSELMMEVWVAPSPERVFAAIEDPFLQMRWYGPPPGCYRTRSNIFEVDRGEQFQVDMIDARGVAFTHLARVLDMEAPKSITLEMDWEGGPMEAGVTRASLTLHPVEGGTRLELRQGPFASPEAVEAYRALWQLHLKRLARVAAGEVVSCFEELKEESNGFGDPLGVAAYAVLAALREVGAAPEVIAQVEQTLYSHLERLPEDTAGLLAAVLRTRLGEVSS